MTKMGSSSGSKKFILGLSLIGALCSACAKSRSGAFVDKAIRSSSDVQIIGGSKVDPTAPIAGKVLYLAFGVEVQKNVNGTRVQWQGHCTASALSARVVLTAAHCVDQKDVQQLSITFGQNPETDPLNLSQWYHVVQARVHPNYVSDTHHIANDLALLLLDRALPVSRVMKLATKEQVQVPLNFMSVGYGITSDSSNEKQIDESPRGLFMVMKKLSQLDSGQNFFSLDQTDHKGFCNGDSGGPGVIQDPKTKEYLILGVVSNTSMLSTETQTLNPNGAYSLCVGHGNYSNTLNPDLRTWIESNWQALEKSSS